MVDKHGSPVTDGTKVKAVFKHESKPVVVEGVVDFVQHNCNLAACTFSSKFGDFTADVLASDLEVVR